MNQSERFIDADQVTQIAVGDFRLDLAQRRLLGADGAVVELSPRLFDALVFFVEHRGELLDKDRLMAALWPGQVVEENNLNKAVSALRRALGDDGVERRYLLTVPRRGFGFVADVHAPAPAMAPDPRPPPPAETGQEPAAPAARAGRLRRRYVIAASAAGAGCAAVAAIYAWHRHAPALPMRAPMTLAVLPFRPLTEERRDEALELGMADSLIARLSVAPGVIVRAVGSVRRYAGRDVNALHAARELEVAWVLEGSLQQSDGRLRVTARLLDARDGTAAWSGNFDELFTGVFEVQDAISRRVADVLVPRLSEQQRTLLGAGGTRSADAYRYYLQARYHAQLFTPEAFRSALSLYEQALAADPRYAYAYVGKADLHRRTLFTSNAAPRTALDAARAAATRAVELDPQFGDAWAQLAWVMYYQDWDWPRAELTMRHAMELNPSCVDAHYGLAHVLMTLGHGSEALQSFTQARQIDPHSLLVNAFEGGMLAMHGRIDDGLERIDRALAINPRFWIAHLIRGAVLLNSARTEAGLQAMRLAVELGGGSAWNTGPLAHALATTGHVDEARRLLGEMLAIGRAGYVSAAQVALVYAGLGEAANALNALEQAYEARDNRLVFLQVDHRWAPLRTAPRFMALVQKLRLDPRPPPWKSTF